MGLSDSMLLTDNLSNISKTLFSNVDQSLQGPRHIDDLKGLMPTELFEFVPHISVRTADIIYD